MFYVLVDVTEKSEDETIKNFEIHCKYCIKGTTRFPHLKIIKERIHKMLGRAAIINSVDLL